MFHFFKNGNKKAKTSYYNVHNLIDAQKLSSGKGVKIGVIDWLFGDEKAVLFDGYVDLTGGGFTCAKEHGFMMSKTLKEIVPDCQIYAINGISKDIIKNDEERAKMILKAVDFATANDIKILTYSQPEIVGKKAKSILCEALKKANKNGIITTFIHCENKHNINPVPTSYMGKLKKNMFKIFEYDYSALNPVAYTQWIESKKENNNLFLSWSSMAPVLAGFIAMLIELKNSLTKNELVSILQMGSNNGVVDIYNSIVILKGRKHE